MYGYAGLGDITPTFELGSARTFQGALDGAPVFLRVRSCRTPSTFAQLDYDTERWTHALGAGHQVRASEAGLVACVAPRCQGASLSELAQSSLDAHGFVTTEKDWVRLRSLPAPKRPVYVVRVRLALTSGETHWRAAFERLAPTAGQPR